MDTKVKQQSSRRKFLQWSSISSLALFAGLQFHKLFSSKTGETSDKPPQRQFVKMLTQDGKLVEVDVTNRGCGPGKKISDDELKNWVKNK